MSDDGLLDLIRTTYDRDPDEVLREHGYVKRHEPVSPKECPVCGGDFVFQVGQSKKGKHRRDATYCSKKCGDRASYLRRVAS